MLRRVALVRTDVTANVIPSSPILVTLMIEELSSSETSVLTRATRRDISEDAILHSHRSENLKSYELTIVYSALYFGICVGSIYIKLFITYAHCLL
jgi:hypothetical protein